MSIFSNQIELPLSRYLTSESPNDKAGRTRYINDISEDTINTIKDALLIIFVILLLCRQTNKNYVAAPLFAAICFYYVNIYFAGKKYDDNLEYVIKNGYDNWYNMYYGNI